MRKEKRHRGGILLLAATTALVSLAGVAPHVSAQAPDWQVNPSEFESNMSIAAVLQLDGLDSTNPDDLVAAFSGEDVRGVTGPVDAGGRLMFFLTVYSNASAEDITFKAYVKEQDRVFDIGETVTFVTNGIVGTVADPFLLTTATLGSCSRGRPDWQVNPADFESNLSVTAQVAFEGNVSADPGDLLAAVAGTEIRGVASPTMTGTGQAFFLTVYANTSGEEIDFVAYDAMADLVRPVAESLVFVPNAIHGTPGNPFAMSASCSTTSTDVEPVGGFQAGELVVYPNPVVRSATLVFESARGGPAMLQVFDLTGRRVLNSNIGQLAPGKHHLDVDTRSLPAGVYISRLTVRDYAYSQKMVVAH